MRVVADTGPLNYLVLLEQEWLLGEMFDSVVIAQAVRSELSDPEAPAQVRNWIVSPPSWLSISDAPSKTGAALPEALGHGERATINLAVGVRAGLVLMDDRAGVVTARACGLLVTGTLGLLYRAALRGLVDLPKALDQLKTTNFHYTPSLLTALLARLEAGAGES